LLDVGSKAFERLSVRSVSRQHVLDIPVELLARRAPGWS
jgi:hypothetical protein